MNPVTRICLIVLIGALGSFRARSVPGADLSEEFQAPPAAARPWVYCFCLEGNVTREGITADLEEGLPITGVGTAWSREADRRTTR